MRLIDADKLLRDIEHYHLSDGKFQHWVEIQPTIEERKTGKWMPHNCLGRPSIDKDVCSECGQRFYQIAETGCAWHYCPNCGARMEDEA